MGILPQKMMPKAERNQFAVEIYLPTGTSLKKTAEIADTLEHLLRKDDRVLSIASFKGSASPRFQTAYAPQFGGKKKQKRESINAFPFCSSDILQRFWQHSQL